MTLRDALRFVKYWQCLGDGEAEGFKVLNSSTNAFGFDLLAGCVHRQIVPLFPACIKTFAQENPAEFQSYIEQSRLNSITAFQREIRTLANFVKMFLSRNALLDIENRDITDTVKKMVNNIVTLAMRSQASTAAFETYRTASSHFCFYYYCTIQ